MIKEFKRYLIDIGFTEVDNDEVYITDHISSVETIISGIDDILVISGSDNGYVILKTRRDKILNEFRRLNFSEERINSFISDIDSHNSAYKYYTDLGDELIIHFYEGYSDLLSYQISGKLVKVNDFCSLNEHLTKINNSNIFKILFGSDNYREFVLKKLIC